MNNVLVISDVELLNQLYLTNLNVYLNVSVTLCQKIAEVTDLVMKNKYDLIITLSNIEKEEVIPFLETLKTPIIVVGENEKYKNQYISIKGYYDLKSILKESAKKLKITPQSMMEIDVGEYFPFAISTLKFLKKTPVNLFLEINKGNSEKNYTLFLKSENPVTEMFAEFNNNGIEFIFVNSYDRLKFANAISLSIIDFISVNSKLTTEQKEEVVATSMNVLATSLVSEEVSPDILNLVNKSTVLMGEIIKEVPTLTRLLKSLLANRNGHIYTHSMLSAYIASTVVKKVPWGGDSHLEKINFVLFFHDIALVPVFDKYPNFKTEEDLLFIDTISEEDKNLILNHARISAELVTGLKKCPIGADLMIKQHHGINNGIGFATEYRDDISPLSKIIIISEAFVEEMLCMRERGEGINLDLIIEKLNERFPKHTYKKIIETLNSLKI